ncbi:MAG: hypothetical protein P8Y76_04390 [bacterium]|jgi:sterol desaturase/sphingolipid hydroxylase (fatty acid hydroxylase superfamily)
MEDHWLARDSTIRLLWRVFIAVLVLTVLAEFAVDLHPHFAIEQLFGFGAWYGFGACAALIVTAKVLGVLLKRPDRYYREDEHG